MKRIIAVVLSVCLLAFSLPLQSRGAGEYTYTNENGNITITKYSGASAVCEIPDTIDGCPVTAIGDGAFRFNTTVTEVILPDSVKEIRTRAFDYRSAFHLKRSTFPIALLPLATACFSAVLRSEA